MPFCLENYIPLFNGLVDYFEFIKRRLERTNAYKLKRTDDPGLSYMIENNRYSQAEFTLMSKLLPPTLPVPNNTAKPKKGRLSSRNVLNSAYDNLRSGRTHLLLKHEQYLEGINSDMLVAKKLTAKQREQFQRHKEYVRLEEEKQLKLVDTSVVEQTKMIMTIVRNFISNKFNEKTVFNEKKLLNILYDILLYNNESELDKLALENFAVISRNIILSELEASKRDELLEKIIFALNADFSEIYDLGIENLHNLMLNQENESFLEQLLPRFIGILVKFLMNNNSLIVERVLEIICHFSDMKISTRVLFARQNYFFSRLLGTYT